LLVVAVEEFFVEEQQVQGDLVVEEQDLTQLVLLLQLEQPTLVAAVEG
tara:strand:+ start:407 stop:550 length:144 start_codon:yes stop_codon:yes gene_type:complete